MTGNTAKIEPLPRSSSPSSRAGMGSLPFPGGAAFRVWAPHAEAVAVAGDFNGWSDDSDPLSREGGGYWSGEVPGARAGQRYRYVIWNGSQRLERKDPYARDVDHSNGPCVIVDGDSFDWSGDAFRMPPWNELVIYEMHLGTFNDEQGGAPGNLAKAIERLSHVVELGANAVQIMPLAEFPGGYSWGYNPSDIFAVESNYGGLDELKTFVKVAHELCLAVIIDVVYNHLGPSDLTTWQFDGALEPGKGGIYFYNDWRSWTPWSDTGRPDYGRGEVRQYLRDNALYWLEDCRADGLRWDMTLYIRTVFGNEADAGQALPDGYSLMQWINREIAERSPWKISIAEDLQDNPWLTRGVESGGAAFGSQWAANFVHPVRRALIAGRDEDRSMADVRAAILGRYDDDAFRRVIYTESHDEVANGRARLPQDIAPQDPGGWFARKRSALGAVLVFTAPGIPMVFQGQEFLEDEWFRDVDPLDWSKKQRFAGIFRLYQDLIRMRRDRARFAGLQGHNVNVFHCSDPDKVIAFHRWDRGGPGDDVVLVLNVANRAYDRYRIGLPRPGAWRVRFNSDWSGYSSDFGSHPGHDATAERGGYDGLDFHGEVGIGPYAALVLTQDR
ncbi:MAG TPA: alpha-amylase family glycosyl hydrolase [Dongiaceae bacterium]|nr:alpha-amylase family glycosyl hydrolase [Dongiaceae bacterium]